jgi:adenine-specific DNA methylase
VNRLNTTAREPGVPNAELAEPVICARPSERTLLESALPFRELSLVALADQRAGDPVYAAHRWWARRPPGVMRGLLLAAALPAHTTRDAFWEAFASDARPLAGISVHDPFVGGGSTLVEAARLGATTSGTDVDPLSVKIVQHELGPPLVDDVRRVGRELITNVEQKVGHLFSSARRDWEPLHYFYVPVVDCPRCLNSAPLYRSPVIARDAERIGAVVRDDAVSVFCPHCFRIHGLASTFRKELRCCGRRVNLSAGTFTAGRFTCPKCSHRATHSELQTGRAARRLVAVEETSSTQSRRIRAPTACERTANETAKRYLKRRAALLALPSARFSPFRRDARPLTFGISKATEMLSPRQLAVFGHAFSWLAACRESECVKRALALMLSNALTTNNRLCGYATDYGRLAPLFSIRSYSLLSVPA